MLLNYCLLRKGLTPGGSSLSTDGLLPPIVRELNTLGPLYLFQFEELRSVPPVVTILPLLMRKFFSSKTRERYRSSSRSLNESSRCFFGQVRSNVDFTDFLVSISFKLCITL